MKSYSRIFIVVLVLVVVLAATAWIGFRQLAHILDEFNRVSQVDLVLMETAAQLNEIQLKKEIIFEKLYAAAEELAFSKPHHARQVYLVDYVKGLNNSFEQTSKLALAQINRVMTTTGTPSFLRSSFDRLSQEVQRYDGIIQQIFNEVARGGFELSLEDLDHTNMSQAALSRRVSSIVQMVWQQIYRSAYKSQHWQERSNQVFYLSVFLSMGLVVLLFLFKENLDAINRQRQEWEKLNKELDRFVHTVSHDIAGPLTTIVGYAAYLESHYTNLLDKKGQDCISGVRKGAHRLNILIKDMLELTKITRVKNPFERVAVQQMITAALANCDFMIKQTGADIHIEGKMPEIVCDRIKTTAAFSNLISNAIKFSAPHHKPIVTIGYTPQAQWHEFYVSDNGIGIDVKHREEIFDIFKRLHTWDEYIGSGVGLAIVKAAIEDQSGRVHVESQVGRGSTFTFTIPKNLQASRSLYE